MAQAANELLWLHFQGRLRYKATIFALRPNVASFQWRLASPRPTAPASTALLDHVAAETRQSWQLIKISKFAANLRSDWQNIGRAQFSEK
jgi:hypothetical protein